MKDLLINIQLDPKENLPLDLKILKKLKKLETFHFEYFGDMEPIYKNINTMATKTMFIISTINITNSLPVSGSSWLQECNS